MMRMEAEQHPNIRGSGCLVCWSFRSVC